MAAWQYRGGDMVGLKELADDEIRLAGPIQSDSIVDGPGLRRWFGARVVTVVVRVVTTQSRGIRLLVT